MSLRSIAKSILPRSLRNAIRFAIWARGDAAYRKATGRSDFPPAYLRVRVHGDLDIPGFFAAGEHCARDIAASLGADGRSLGEFRRVLDFGCGSGRTLLALRALMPQAEFFGTDTDADAIRWDRQHLNFGQYETNKFEPPLSYPDGQFDLIYAISVFTHIDERLQDLWLAELQRVAAPGALLLLTVHGISVAISGKLTADQEKQFKERGFLFVRDRSWSDLFPDFYQTTYHARSYIEKRWTQWFGLIDYRERGMDGLQDIVVLRCRS